MMSDVQGVCGSRTCAFVAGFVGDCGVKSELGGDGSKLGIMI